MFVPFLDMEISRLKLSVARSVTFSGLNKTHGAVFKLYKSESLNLSPNLKTFR